MNNTVFRGMWGFEIVAGKFVGGGLFRRVPFEDAEESKDSVLATRQGPGWLYAFGYLTLTNRRLIFTPYRWRLPGRPPLSLPYADIARVEAGRRRNPVNPTSFMANALVVTKQNGSSETFWAAKAAEVLAPLIRARLVSP